jgi:alkanesulfonate monooxygenase
MTALRFHWRLPPGGERPDVWLPSSTDPQSFGLPDIEARAEFCRLAEQSGIDSTLTMFGYNAPDPMLLAAALALRTERLTFMVAYRPGLMSPTLFVQQVNTFSALTGGRISLNIVAGHSQKELGYYGDFLAHDERYARAEEFLHVTRELWRGGCTLDGKYYKIVDGQVVTPFVSPERSSPEVFVGGSSPQAQRLALNYGTCWLLLGDTPEAIRGRVEAARAAGVEVGLRFSVIIRPTREEAVRAAYEMVKGGDTSFVERHFTRSSDSVSMKAVLELPRDEGEAWLTPYLWKGAVASHGVSAIALVGSPADIATALLEYESVGVSQFILSGWPNAETLEVFSREVLPLVREGERRD